MEAIVPLQSTHLVPVDDRLRLEAAVYSRALGLRLADALIYATARRFDAVLHSSDPDLKGVAGVVFHEP